MISTLATALAGCGGPTDVSAEGVKSKEQQAEEATRKLNGGKTPDQAQGTDSQ